MTVERLMASICSGIASTNASSTVWPKFAILMFNTRQESNSGRTPNTSSQGQTTTQIEPAKYLALAQKLRHRIVKDIFIIMPYQNETERQEMW